jgi:hypothetical protein
MIGTTRFGRKLKVPSTFQLKHQFLIWWLKRQAATEVANASAKSIGKLSSPMHAHEPSY